MNRTRVERIAALSELSTIPRADWTSAWARHERLAARDALIDLARVARTSTTLHEALVLYKAAHAVLPLTGPTLIELASLLLDQGEISDEWLDVLVRALSCADPVLSERIRSYLNQAYTTNPTSRKVQWARRWEKFLITN